MAPPLDRHLHTPSEVTPVHIYVCGTGTDICRAVDHDDITEPKGSITPRHSRVRPTFHSGQYGLSTRHQPTMAGHEQSKTQTMEMIMKTIATALIALSVLSGAATLANAAGGEEFCPRTTAGQQGSPN